MAQSVRSLRRAGGRQRSRPLRYWERVEKSPLFHIVLHEPEIPNHTGNIGRTCIATGCALHLIRPLGFDTSEKALRRAGLDYWPRLRVQEHENWEAYLNTKGLASAAAEGPLARDPGSSERVREPGIWLTSGKAGRPVWEADLRPGDHIVFGKETRGLPEGMLSRWPDHVLTLPTVPGERGLNVATVVCAVVYEGIRQCVARADTTISGFGRLVVPSPLPGA